MEDRCAERRVVVSPSTGDGLARLVSELGADVITFGPEYRTPRGRVAVGRSAQALLENGPAAVALAPAGYAGSAGARARHDRDPARRRARGAPLSFQTRVVA